ncbi:MAG: adenylate/guanylate cyclase domain-containing protein [Lacunisphaera sp.]|nr:adenylate/guanylate cyclase domain-containing protein [Lacunisphaera sp.]
MAFRVFRFRRFSSQLLLLLAGLIALVQVAVYLSISRANERNAIDHIDQSLQTGARIFQQNLAERIDYLAGSAKVMSSDYPIRQLMMQDPLDERTLRSALVSYSERVNAPVITLLSPEGEVIALTDVDLRKENVGPFAELIRLATRDDLEQISGYSYLAGRLHVLVVVPLYAPYPNVAAWFGVAYPIDTKFAQAIKNTTRLEVTFTSDNPSEQPPRVLSTTLDGAMAQTLARHVPRAQALPRQSETVTLHGEDYVTLFQKLDLLGEAPVRIALQRSLRAELAPARELENAVLLISLAALAAATLAALWIAHGISQPLQQLAAHTESVAAGDYTRRIDLPREDELGQLATAFNHMTAGLAERDRVRDLLGKVVSPEIATQLLQSDLQLGGEEREVTILFCDLRDFTGMSEKMNPTDVLALLNRYLDRMSTIIERHGGVIDKYIGDAIMALWGAPITDPGSAGKAIAAAREMAQALQEFNRELAAEGRPALVFGIGINTARVVAGNMGSKTRLNYTVIGDGVNLASRLESLTKDPAYDTPIIISEATLRALPNPPPARELGEVRVKGKAGAVKIYALTAKGESTPPYAV